MAATTGRLVPLAIAFLLSIAACSGTDDDIGAELDAAAEEAATSTTTTTPPSSTTTTEPTTTTLSELEQAEAEIRHVVIEWYQTPVDYSLGEEGIRIGQTTGLLRQRIIESAARLEADGQTVRTIEPSRVEIIGVEVDLVDGTAEADACTGSGTALIDVETEEVLRSGDASETSTSVFQLQFVDNQWLIYEWVSSAGNGDPVYCEVGP